jgi:hypothetical protein
MKSNSLVLLALASAALVAPSARANDVSNVDIEGLRIVLHDLDPSDGITPSLVFTSGDSGVSTYADSLQVTRSAPQLFAPVSSTLNVLGLAISTAIARGDIFGTGMSLSASTAASEGRPANDAGAFNDLGYHNLPIWVMSPHTSLELMGSASVETSLSEPQNADSGIADIEIGLSADGNSFLYTLNARLFSQQGSLARQGAFDLTIANTGSSEMSGALDIHERSSVFAQAVPEPPSVTLLFGGLGLLVTFRFLRRPSVQMRGRA